MIHIHICIFNIYIITILHSFHRFKPHHNPHRDVIPVTHTTLSHFGSILAQGGHYFRVCRQVCDFPFAFSLRRTLMVRMVRDHSRPKKGKGKGNQDDVGVQHRAGAGIPGSGARVPGGPEFLQRWPRGFCSQDGARRCIEAGQGTGRCTHPHRPGCQSWCGPRESGEVRTGHCSNGELPGGGVGHVDHFIEESTEGCSGDTDQSSRSFHRTFQEEDRTIRRRACSRSPEAGGGVRKDWRSSGPWFLFSQLHHSLSMPVQK